MIPITVEQAWSLYLKAKGLTPAGLRIMTDDHSDGMELWASVTISLGDKIAEAEAHIDELVELNERLQAAVTRWSQLTGDQLRDLAAGVDARAARLAVDERHGGGLWQGTEWVGTARAFELTHDAVIEGLAAEVAGYLALEDAKRAESERRHPANYTDTTATESDETGPNRD